MKQNQKQLAMDAGRMTSLEIAAVTGKPHGDVLKAQDRAFHYYSLEGEKKERAYLVWTPIGMEFIRTIV